MILVFPQVTSVGKNSKNISRLGVASPRKPFFLFFPTSAKPWGNTKITREQFFPQAEKGKKVKQNTISSLNFVSRRKWALIKDSEKLITK